MMFVSPQVNKEIVSGLKYVQQTYRKGMKSELTMPLDLFAVTSTSRSRTGIQKTSRPPLSQSEDFMYFTYAFKV